MDLNELPAPARHLTRKYRDNQAYFRASWRPVGSTLSSRGCPYRCRFCGIWKVQHGGYRFRSAAKIADDVASMDDPYVVFLDDNTIGHVRNARNLATELRRRGIRKTYELYGRADTVVRHPDLIEDLRDVGMKLLLLGLESPNPSRLEAWGKRSSAGMNEAAIGICHGLGVEIVAYLIVDPAFTRDDFRRLGDYVEEHHLTHPVFTILVPFPGTELYEQVKGSLTTHDLRLYDFYHAVTPTTLPLDEFYAEFLKLYQRSYPMFSAKADASLALLNPAARAQVLELQRRMADLHRHHALCEGAADSDPIAGIGPGHRSASPPVPIRVGA